MPVIATFSNSPSILDTNYFMTQRAKGFEGGMEHKFAGNLCKILDEIDTSIKTTIANRRPIPVSDMLKNIK